MLVAYYIIYADRNLQVLNQIVLPEHPSREEIVALVAPLVEGTPARVPALHLGAWRDLWIRIALPADRGVFNEVATAVRRGGGPARQKLPAVWGNAVLFDRCLGPKI